MSWGGIDLVLMYVVYKKKSVNPFLFFLYCVRYLDSLNIFSVKTQIKTKISSLVICVRGYL